MTERKAPKAARFKDLFSLQASDYAKFRPRYPVELFTYLASLPRKKELALDCGTGNGQAAVALASHFRRVLATDPSAKQLAAAERRDNVEYRAAKAQDSGLAEGSVDLVTVAQALHWIELETFYREVRRVARAEGAYLAVWSYGLAKINASIDPIVDTFCFDILQEYWEPERRYVDEGYRNMPFPFREVEAPAFAMEAHWTLAQLRGYLATWSAVQAAIRLTGENPLEKINPQLEASWGVEESRKVSWPLALRIGKV